MKYRDFEEFIASLNESGVRYLVVGAHAVAFHARPRATKDLDTLVEPTQKNAARVLRALREFFGGAELGYSISDLTNPDTVLQLGIAPVRIDILTAIDGIESFGAAWARRVEAKFGEVPANYLSFEDLMASKEAAGRPQDRADLVVLRRVLARRNAAPKPGQRKRKR
jgi:hypothetical protein